MKEIKAGVETFIERLESETKDVELYGPLVEQEECPICFLPVPRPDSEQVYMPCCGKTLCGGCAHSSVLISVKAKKKSVSCAFCRFETRPGDYKETAIAQYRDRAEKNDAKAIKVLANKYNNGEYGLPKDEVMARRLFLRAAELGSLGSINSLALYFSKEDAPQDAVFAMQLATIAAKKGHLESYYLLGFLYHGQDDVENAAKCWIFAARAGHSDSTKALRAYNKKYGANVLSDDDLEAIEETYKDAVNLEWSEGREAFKKVWRGEGSEETISKFRRNL
jgi:TPR repeat protein